MLHRQSLCNLYVLILLLCCFAQRPQHPHAGLKSALPCNTLADEGKNPFTLDSKAPNWANFRDFLLGEVRYLSVQKAFPKEADELFTQAEKMAKLRYQTYVRKSQEDWSEQI